MTRISMARMVLCAGIIYAGAVAEAGAAASPPQTACFNACEQAQTACSQRALQAPPAQRTVKDINIIKACSRTEEKCDHRCRAIK
jgi:hypothetical protein